MKKVVIFLLSLFSLHSYTQEEKPFVIVICSYNNSEWYQGNLDSVFNQKYENYRVIYIDDCSSDGTGELVEAYISEHNVSNRITLIKNSERKLAMHNHYVAGHMAHPYEIIVHLDGDDRLAHDLVLDRLNREYANRGVWMTYGQYAHWPAGGVGGAEQLPINVILNNSIREYPYVTTALRSYYAGLFHLIDENNFKYNDQFLPMTYDVAIMFPLLELAGIHSRFISDVLYIYNTATPINDNKVNKNLQHQMYCYICKLPKYEALNELPFKSNILH